jgi:hypothetical protein
MYVIAVGNLLGIEAKIVHWYLQLGICHFELKFQEEDISDLNLQKLY